MSGPKVDTATLAEMRRQQLEEQRRRRQELAGETRKTIDALRERCEEICAYYEQDDRFRDELAKTRKKQAEYEKQLTRMLNSIASANDLFSVKSAEKELQELRRAIEEDVIFGSSDIVKTIHELAERCDGLCEVLDKDGGFEESSGNTRKKQAEYEDKLIKLLRKAQNSGEAFGIDQMENELRDIRWAMERDQIFANSETLIRSNEELQKIKRETEAVANTKRHIITALSSAAPEPEAGITEEDVNAQAEAFEEDIKLRMEKGEMTGTHKNSILLISQDFHELRDSSLPPETKSKRMRRLYAQYEKVNGLIRSEMEVLRAAYNEYLAECFDSAAAPAPLSDFSSVSDIKRVAKEAKELAENRISQDYIRRQIDDVMAKHGYNVIRSDQLEEASGQVLYGVDEDSAINVFVSDDNLVTMRVVGIGFDSDISDAESEKLYQQQCAFCSLHPQLTAELEKRGVILTTRKHNPPDKKFNKKVKVRTKKDERSAGRNRAIQKRQELRTMYKEND